MLINALTGFGRAASADDHGISCSGGNPVGVNNRFFKATIKLPDRLASLEPELDKVLRESLVRGSIVLAVSVREHASPTSVTINQAVLKTYIDQLEALMGSKLATHSGVGVDLANVLALPGVIEAGEDTVEYLATHEDLVLRLVKGAIDKLNEMRKREGAALWADLQKHVEIIRGAAWRKSRSNAPNGGGEIITNGCGPG